VTRERKPVGYEELDQKARAALEDRLTWKEGDLEVVEWLGEKRKEQELGGAMALIDMILSISEHIKVNRYRMKRMFEKQS
jgi:hypothetical protein